MAAFIEDGHTADGKVEASPGFYESVAFKFRPATSSEVKAWARDRGNVNGDGLAQIDRRFLASHLVSWDLKTSKGNAVEISDINCGRLNTQVATIMMDFICGDTAELEASKGN